MNIEFITKAMQALRSPDVVTNLEGFHVELAKFAKFLEHNIKIQNPLEVEEYDFLHATQKYLAFLKTFGVDLEI